MYKVINVDGEDYKLEFSIEASLYNDCVIKITSLMIDISDAQTANDVKQLISGISDLPKTALSCFYAGLLEHHGTEEGDGKIPNFESAKKLAVKMIRSEDETVCNWHDLLTLCVEQMGEDGFFDLIGIGKELSPKEKVKKVPQDHHQKKKATGK